MTNTTTEIVNFYFKLQSLRFTALGSTGWKEAIPMPKWLRSAIESPAQLCSASSVLGPHTQWDLSVGFNFVGI